MGQNLDDYLDFQQKITHPKHFSGQCMYYTVHKFQSFAQVFFYEFLKEQLHNCIDCKKNAKLCFSCDMKALLLLRVIKVMEFCDSGFELAWVAMVPGTRRVFGQYCLAHAGFGNFTT